MEFHRHPIMRGTLGTKIKYRNKTGFESSIHSLTSSSLNNRCSTAQFQTLPQPSVNIYRRPAAFPLFLFPSHALMSPSLSSSIDQIPGAFKYPIFISQLWPSNLPPSAWPAQLAPAHSPSHPLPSPSHLHLSSSLLTWLDLTSLLPCRRS